MKTYPLQRHDGTQFAFEIGNSFTSLAQISKLLLSVDKVTEVKRVKGSEDRISFKYVDEPFVVNEPWGDNSRFWVGPVNPDKSVIDIEPLHEAFVRHQGVFIRLIQYARLK